MKTGPLTICVVASLASLAMPGSAERFAAAQPAVQLGTSAESEEPEQVVIEREPLMLRNADDYQVTLQLRPVKSVELVALTGGIVANIAAERGAVLQKHAEAVRLDSRERQLELERAKAALAAAEAEAAAAGDSAGAGARLEVARIDVHLAEYHLDQSIIRAPFAGTVMQVHVVPGQFVRAGDPVVTLSDLTVLSVEVPVDRNATKEGDPIPLRIEGRTSDGRVDSVHAIPPRFEPLRGLFESIAAASVLIDNGNAQWAVGQTVYSPMIPRQPVSEVPNVALVNGDDGTRRVQVIREGFVRNVPVDLLGPVGEDHTYVSGRFGPTDELIVRSSQPLLDGTQVIPRTELEDVAEQGGGGSSPARQRGSAPAAVPRPRTSF